MGKMLADIKWHILHRGYQLRMIMVYFLVLDVVLAILPVQFCQYLDRNFMFLVMVVNLTYALSVFYFFITGLTYVDGQEGRLFARLFTNLIFTLFCFGNAMLGSSLMNKFADANHTYFELEMNGNIPAGFLFFAVAAPLLYHLVGLIARRGSKKYFSIPALILVFFLMDLYKAVLTRLPGSLAPLISAVIIAAVFFKAEKLEKNGNKS